jgi:hypothetical protein
MLTHDGERLRQKVEAFDGMQPSQADDHFIVGFDAGALPESLERFSRDGNGCHPVGDRHDRWTVRVDLLLFDP